VPICYEERGRELAEHIELPQSYYEAMEHQAKVWPRVYQLYLRNWGLYDEETARRYMLMNLLQIEALDAAIGRLLAALDERGLYEDSVVIFAGDHGEMNCERGLIDKGVYGHPRVALIPLSVKLPGGEGAARRVDDMVSLLDLAPTLFDVAGVQPTERLDGESLLPLIRGGNAARERPLIFECGWHVGPNPAVSTFAELDGVQFMYTYNLTSDLDELYDLDDPSYRGLSGDPQYAAQKLEMIRRLGRVLEADPRWTCYWHTFRLDRYEHLDVEEGDFQMFRPD
jgi:arylsulfatase A-like enzyme